jgi:hypothetical protein
VLTVEMLVLSMKEDEFGVLRLAGSIHARWRVSNVGRDLVEGGNTHIYLR